MYDIELHTIFTSSKGKSRDKIITQSVTRHKYQHIVLSYIINSKRNAPPRALYVFTVMTVVKTFNRR